MHKETKHHDYRTTYVSAARPGPGLSPIAPNGPCRRGNSRRASLSVCHVGGCAPTPVAETASSSLAPAVAAPSEVDPILDVIKRHLRAVKAYNKAEIAFHSYEDESRPGVVVGEYPEHKRVTLISTESEEHFRYEPTGKMLPVFASCKYDLEKYAPADLGEVERAKWVNKRYKVIRRAQRVQDSSPRSLAYDEWCERGNEVTRINKELFATTPTTMAGTAALLAHWSKVMTDRDCSLDWISTQDFLGRLSRGLRAAGRLS
jgi:hypothetical protein